MTSNKLIALNNGYSMPILGLGTFLLRPPHILTVTEAALNLGYKLIDTAAVYKNEHSIGQVLNKVHPKRSDIFITSKLGPSHQGTEKCKQSAFASLEALQLDYLDLYLIHWPGTSGLKPDNDVHSELRRQSWLQLENLYKQGKFKAIGVSNYTISHIKELLEYCTVIPAVLQVEVHPFLIQSELRQFCKEHRIHVQAYSSLGSKSGSQELLNDPVVLKVAEVHNKTPAQVLLRWAIEHGMSVIPKTSNVHRLKENMNIFDFCLSASEMKILGNLDKEMHFCWNPDAVK